MNKKIKDFCLVTIGSLIASLGFSCFMSQNHIASGGVVGLAVSLHRLLGWNEGNFVLIANVPLLLSCYFLLGKEIFLKTVYGAWIYSFFIKITENLPTMTHNPLLAGVFGGILTGFGLGIVFLGNSSTGGTGIITQILHKYTPLPLAVAMTLIDGVSVSMGFVAFDADTVMYSIMSLIVISYVVNIMQVGTNSSRNVMIVSKKTTEIKSIISKTIDRGVTEIPVIGGFSGKNQTMMMTTVSGQEVPRLEKNILKVDETAFIIVTPASRVRGRGFSLTKDYQLDSKDIILPM